MSEAFFRERQDARYGGKSGSVVLIPPDADWFKWAALWGRP